MRSKRLAAAVLAVYMTGFVAPVSADQGDSMVRVKDGHNGNVVVNLLCNALLCDVLGALDVLAGAGTGREAVPRAQPARGHVAAEPDPEPPRHRVRGGGPCRCTSPTTPFRSDQASASVLDELWRGDTKAYYGTPCFQSYLEQPAAEIVAVRHTHCGLRATGGGIVAVIDTGVDRTHPTLAPHLVDGYDFTRNVRRRQRAGGRGPGLGLGPRRGAPRERRHHGRRRPGVGFGARRPTRGRPSATARWWRASSTSWPRPRASCR